MKAGYLAGLGLPFGGGNVICELLAWRMLHGGGVAVAGSPVLLHLPEESQDAAGASGASSVKAPWALGHRMAKAIVAVFGDSFDQAPKQKQEAKEAKPKQDVKSKPTSPQAGALGPARRRSPAFVALKPADDWGESLKETSDGRSFLEKIDTDLAKGGRCHGQKVLTRFPPEPNGYLHIGHAKSITINFGLAQKYGGGCNLRFDDTNPDTEETEYVESIQEDVCWVCQGLDMEKCKAGGKPWVGEPVYASDYFQKMYDFAIDLIKHGKAYVDSQTPEEVQKNRGGGPNNLPGVDSPFRNRSVEENLRLFEEMQAGKHAEGSLLLRAKIDMNHPNMNMRDPPMYRIRFSHHHRTGDRWKVYPIYDFAHGNEDAIEGVTHSICTLEFENHRALYDWFLDNTSIVPSRPYQKEFARLEVQGAFTSKRKLLRLVREGYVTGWDDPRLLTVRGIRRRGVRPQGVKRMCDAASWQNP
ncbi:glnS [Symbiodinium sp. CCMP2592]|nr:glnS [Symbiodinium sp. CCMP2592]